jgi:hypothetical protein
MARDPLSAVPLNDGLVALFLAAHALLLLFALRDRVRISFTWFSLRRITLALALGLAVIGVGQVYLVLPGLAGIEGWSIATPGPYSHYHQINLSWFPPRNYPWLYGGPAISEALASVYALGMLGPWGLGGMGLAALCYALPTLELERSGARQLAVTLGAVGYAILFMGEPLALAAAAPERSQLLILAAQTFERYLIGVGAGYVFLASRHLLGAGITLGLFEWTIRYLCNEAQSTRFAPLFLAEAPDQVWYWSVRLSFATIALLVPVLYYWSLTSERRNEGPAKLEGTAGRRIATSAASAAAASSLEKIEREAAVGPAPTTEQSRTGGGAR